MMSTSALRHKRTLEWLSEAVSCVPGGAEGGGLRAGVVAAALRCADLFLSYRNNHPARRLLAPLLAALLPPGTRCLAMSAALGVAESYPLREALLRRLQSLTGLRELALSETLHVHTSVELVTAALCRLQHLASLRAPWLCSDTMAQALAAHCPQLEVLDACESARVTDRGALSLAAGCPRLRVLLLTGCRVSARGYERLLAALPRLQRLGRCPQLGGVVRRAAGAPSLTEWESDHLPDAEEAALCPALVVLALSDVTLLPGEDGAPLPVRVARLRVEKVGLRDHPWRLRVQLGADLTHLDVMEYVLSLQDCVQLGQQCPALRVLKLAVQDEGTAHAVPVHPRREAPFQRLEEFHLYSGPGPLLEYVLLHAYAVQRVVVLPGLAPPGVDLLVWTDADMRRVAAANPLAELRSFSLACRCALTMDTVYTLILGCPKLTALFDLCEWSVSETQLGELQELVAANNWDLELGLARM